MGAWDDEDVIRTPDQRLRVFVSSTLKELREERDAARRAIERLRLTPVLFEQGARPYPPRSLYRAYLEQSQVFVGIYGQQYGWIAPDMDVSGLEDEYRSAEDKPRLIYVREPSPDRDPRLSDLLDRIKREGQTSYKSFRDTSELQGLIEQDLSLLLSERFDEAAPGPIRTTEVPVPASSFIGREREVPALVELIERDDVRLVTLTGPGGIGKTRMALRAASDLRTRFEDGVAVVMLAPVSSGAMVASAISGALGVPETPGRAPLDVLKDFLRPRRMLLVLDNFEHLVEAAPVVVELLEAAGHLKVLVTSREVLRLSGEREFPVPPLSLPERRVTHSTDALAGSEAVRLFVDRAQAVRPDFTLTDELVPVVTEICRRLDGLPLAVELAAAWIRTLAPEAIADRLDRRLNLLTGGARDLPQRQRTLRATLEWSYDLLDEADRSLFERLGVFAGGWTLDAAEAVCAGDVASDVIEGLASLVEKSMVRRARAAPGEPGFEMLETIREFAVERLESRGDAERVRRAHASFFLRMALDAEPLLRTGEQDRTVERLAAENDNLRAAMRWSLDRGEPGRVARMGQALWLFWWVRSLLSEAVAWMEEVLGAGEQLTTEERAMATLVLGSSAFTQGDDARAVPNLRHAVALGRELGDLRGTATALIALAAAVAQTEGATRAEAMAREAVAAFRDLGDAWGIASGLGVLGLILNLAGRSEEAVPVLEESVVDAREVGQPALLGLSLLHLGLGRLEMGDVENAGVTLRESLGLLAGRGNREITAGAVEALAEVSARAGDHETGAVLFGAAKGVRSSVGALVWAPERASHDRTEKSLRRVLGQEAFEARFAEGATLSIPEALELSSRPEGGSSPSLHA
jgi:predicted ATPase